LRVIKKKKRRTRNEGYEEAWGCEPRTRKMAAPKREAA